jgi:type II secretion system protein N
MNKLTACLLYGLYAIAVAGISLAWQVPDDLPARLATAQLNRIHPDLSCSIGSWQWLPPLGLALGEVDIAYQRRPWLRVNRMAIAPEIASLLTASPSIRIRARWADGVSQTTVVRHKGGRLEARSRLSNLDLAAVPMVSALSARAVTGRLSGAVRLQLPAGEPAVGSAELKLKNGAVGLRRAVMGMTRIDYAHAAMMLQLHADTVVLSKLTLAADEMGMDAAGKMVLASDLRSSPLTVRGRILAAEAPAESAFTITGSLADPVIGFN